MSRDGLFVRATMALVAILLASDTQAQFASARRMAMGGVNLLHGGPGGDAVNVAYRAVPPEPRDRARSWSLPIGLIPVLQDPPSLDPDDSTFNVFELANLALHPPWNLALRKPEAPEGDVAVSVARNALVIDLGPFRDAVPDERVRMAFTARTPALVVGLHRAFVGLGPLLQVENDFELGATLRKALHDNAPFLPGTEYGFRDRARGQAAAQAIAGAAWPLLRSSDAQRRDGVYVGARAKLLRGLAYGDVDAKAMFTTADTLFGDAPIDAGYTSRARTALPKDGGWGQGFDVGAVWVVGGLELGVAGQDLASHIAWKVTETSTEKDTTRDIYVTTTLAQGVAFTSTVPTSVLATVSLRAGALLVAADATRDALSQVTGHAGAEWWFGPLALRAGVGVDERRALNPAGGLGLKLGRIGVDVAVISNRANLTRESALDLAAGFTLYPGGAR